MTNPTSPTDQQAVNPFARTARPRGFSRWIPALPALKTYQRSWLSKDLVAGLVLTAILVPVGMGYAEASGLPAPGPARTAKRRKAPTPKPAKRPAASRRR